MWPDGLAGSAVAAFVVQLVGYRMAGRARRRNLAAVGLATVAAAAAAVGAVNAAGRDSSWSVGCVPDAETL